MNESSIFSAGLRKDTEKDVNFSHLNFLLTASIHPSDQEEGKELENKLLKVVFGNFFVTVVSICLLTFTN